MGRFDRVTGYLDGLMEKGIAGGACLVVKGKEEVYRHYEGYADVAGGREPGERTLYRLYSLTKLYTAVAVFTLCEEGKLRLEDAVSDYLPEFAHMEVMRTRGNGLAEMVEAGTAITLRHLLTMQSGLSYPYDNQGAAVRSTRERIESFRSGNKNYSVMEYARMLASVPLAFEPGTHFLYGTGYDVLAAVVEAASGMRFGEYLDQAVLGPMGLRDTMFKINEVDDWNRLAGIYSWNESDGKFRLLKEKDKQYRPQFSFEEGGGGLVATLDDCMRFLLMLQNGGVSETGVRILPERYIELMAEDQLDTVEKLEDYRHQFGGESDYGYGYGVRVKKKNCEPGEFDSPAGEFGWYGMSGNYVLIDRVNQLTLVYMQQMIPGREKEIHGELRKLIYQAIFE